LRFLPVIDAVPVGKGKVAFFRKIPALPFNLIENISPEENRCLSPPAFVPFFLPCGIS